MDQREVVNVLVISEEIHTDGNNRERERTRRQVLEPAFFQEDSWSLLISIFALTSLPTLCSP